MRSHHEANVGGEPARSSARPSITPRFDGVDVLRGLSILAVILLHTFIRMKSAGFSVQQLLPPWLFHLLFRNGDNGVTVFFAISGFLITFTSLRRFGSLSQMRPKQFYRIRAARIAPLLLLILAVLSILHLMNAEGFHIPPQKATLARALFAALTFHLNWLEAVRGYFPANWDVLWSLSVEEMFYLFFPIVCVLLFQFRRGKTLLVALLLVFAAMGPFARSIWTTNPIWQEKSYLGGMDGIALGCLSALRTNRLLQRRDRPRGYSRTFLVVVEIAGAAMMFLIALWPQWPPFGPWMKTIGSTGLDGTVLAVGTCLVIVTTVLRGTIGSRLTAPVRWFGRHSYEVYLTHEFIVVWGTQLYTKVHIAPLAIGVIAILALCAPLGAVVAKYFSEPLNRRFRRSGATKTSSEPDLVNA
ncbi:MAG TPA: acyltransferase [Bryobacteraceae bacterium]|nr:acyltransferase [Bryobacteraceae bacterium]